MKTVDFFTGEPVNGSPLSVEREAAQMASFGRYDYDPTYRAQYQEPIPQVQQQPMMQQQYQSYMPNPYMQPQQVYTGYGYNQSQYYGYNPYGYSANPYMGLGANPYYNNQPFMQPPVQQVQPQPVMQQVIPPINFGTSEYLPPVGWEEELDNMRMDCWVKEQERVAENAVNSNNFNNLNNGFFGFNYYGTPYYNSYMNNNVLYMEYYKKIENMKEQAREARIQLNMGLLRAAYSFLGYDYKEEVLEEYCRGKVVEYSQIYTDTSNIMPSQQEMYHQMKLANLTPYDGGVGLYTQLYNKASEEFHNIIPEDANLKETFKLHGKLGASYEMEDEAHRRRNCSVFYEGDMYKYYVRKKAAERYAASKGLKFNPETGIAVPDININRTDMENAILHSGQFPFLSQVASITEDGTVNLDIPYNVGSRVGQVYSTNNSQEEKYKAERERFNAFLDSIPGSLYLQGLQDKKISGGDTG